MNAPTLKNLSPYSCRWPRARLGDVAEHRLGKMLDQAKNTGTPRRYLRNPNIKWFEIDTSDLKEVLVEDEDIHRYELRSGDVLICEGGEAGRAALWTIDNSDIIFQKACHRVRVGPKLDARYLIHCLQHDYSSGRLEEYYTGATIKHLTGQDLARYEFPLPPLDEQRRIAAILDKADALRRKRKCALDLLDSMAQATFFEMFGRSLSESNVAQKRLGDVLINIDSGWSPVCLSRSAEDGEAGILKLSCISRSGFRDAENKALPANLVADSELEVHSGDVLFVRKNTRELVGATAYVWSCKSRRYISDLIFRLRTRQTMVDAIFLQAQLSTPFQRKRLADLAGGVAGSMPNISKAKLGNLTIFLPTLSSQRTYAAFCTRQYVIRSATSSSAAAAETLFASLQHRAFSGQL